MHVPRWAEKPWGFVKEIYDEFARDNASLVAAALSFYIFLSLIPLLLLAIAIWSYILGSPERAQEVVMTYLRQVTPTSARLESCGIDQAIDQIVNGRGAATGIGIVVLLWSGTKLMTNLEKAINLAWDVTRQRGFIQSRLIGLVLLLLVGVLFVLSFAVTAAAQHIHKHGIHSLGIPPEGWPWLWELAGYAIPLLFTVAGFTLVYRLLPRANVRFRAALLGGILAGLLWEVAKYGFNFYIAHFGSYSSVYGPLTGVILLLVWINYSAVVAILGAEVASTWQRCRFGDE